MKILAFGTHPTDIFDLAGGTLFRHALYKDEIYPVIVTDGVFSHSLEPKIEKNTLLDLQNKRREEVKRASKILQFQEPIFLGYIDEPLIMSGLDITRISILIREYKPDMIISHHPNEFTHFDHSEVGKTVCRAIKTAIKYPSLERHYTPNVYFYGVQFRPEMARLAVNPIAPTVLVDIKDVIEDKKKALFQLESQGLNNMDNLNRRVDSFESETGRADGLRYSESFISYYPLKSYYLPTSINTSFYTNKDTK